TRSVMSGANALSKLPSVLFPSLLFQAEDGIRDKLVTGVQTCALPISSITMSSVIEAIGMSLPYSSTMAAEDREKADSAAESGREIGRASCRESVKIGGRRVVEIHA